VASVQQDAPDEAMAKELRGHSRLIIMRRELPALPLTVVKALGMLGERDLNMRSLSNVLSEDAALAARILTIGRSAYYGKRTVPTTLQAALQVIGLRDLRNVIISIVTHGLFHSYGPVANALWSHSLAVAVTSRILSARLAQADPEQAFLAGLLHDVGQIIFLHDDQEGYSQMANDARQNKTQLVDAEQQHYGLDHGSVGAALIESWGLNADIGMAVTVHHNYQEISDPKSLPAVLVMADYLVLKAGLGFFAPAPMPAPEILQVFALENDQALAQAAITLRHAFNTESTLLNAV
jgi:putative nucleotidyltransferase with HDIG domain